MIQPPARAMQVAALPNGQPPRLLLSPPPEAQPLSFFEGALPQRLTRFSLLIELVAFLHSQGIVPRNICPANLYTSPDDSLYLIDLSHALQLGADRGAKLAPSAYTAPEQCSFGDEGDLFEPRSDLFSLGAILYELLTGHAPFEGAGPAMLLALLEHNPPPPSQRSSGDLAPFDDLCLQLLSKERHDRPASIAEVRAQFGSALSLAAQAPSALQPPLHEPPPPPSPPPAAEAREWRYRSIEALARSGLGKISRAYDQLLARPVALKGLSQRGAEARFVEEARRAARLEHPGIVPIYDLGRLEGAPFYAMKLIEGRSLDALLEESPLPGERLALLPHVIAACDAMAFAHAKQIIHRELRPQKILVGAFGETVIIGWGQARALDKDPAEGALEESQANTEIVLDSPVYMPPEQVSGGLLDARADVYSLGAILYQLLCGHPPYTKKRSLEVIKALIDGPPVPLLEREPRAPRALAAVVQKAMSREAKDRYASAKELSEELKRFRTRQLVGEHSSGELLRRWFQKNRLLVSAGLTLAATILTALIVDDVRVRAQQEEIEKRRREFYEQRELTQMQNDRLEIENERQRKSLEELKLSQAISWLDVDPLMSLSWLHDLDRDYPGQPWGFARLIAFAAELRGLPSSVFGAAWSTPEWVNTSASRGLVFSLDGSLLISGEADGSLRIWSVKTSSCRTLRGHAAAINQLALSPDGEHLASAARDGTVIFWDTSSWKSEALEGAHGELLALSFSADGGLLAWGGASSEVVVWDVAQQQVSARLETSTGEFLSTSAVSSLSFQPGGASLAIAQLDGVVRLWDLASLKSSSKSLKPTMSGWSPVRLVFSSDGRRLFLFGEKLSGVTVMEVPSQKQQRLEASLGSTAATLSPDDRWFVSADLGGALWLWDLRELPKRPKPLRLHGEGPRIESLRFSEDSRSIISGDEDGVVRVFSLSGEPMRVLRGHSGGITQLLLSPRAGVLASASLDHTLRLWEIGGFTRVSGHAAKLLDVSFSADGEEFVTAGLDGAAKVWQTSAPSAPIQSFSAPQTSWILSATFSPGGYWLATASDDNSLYLRSIDGKETRLLRSFSLPPTAARFTADGNYLWVSAEEGTLSCWEIPSGSLVETLYAPDSADEKALSDLALFPDGKRAITVSTGGWLRLWDIEKHELHKDPSLRVSFDTTRLALSPGGRYAVALGRESQLVLWDLEQNEHYLLSHKGVSDVVFASEEVFLTAGLDGSLRAWDVASQQGVALPVWMGAYTLAFDRIHSRLLYSTKQGPDLSAWLRQVELRSSDEVEAWLQAKRLPLKRTL